MNFEINLIFLIKQFYYMTKKSRQKLDILRTEELLRRNKKHFFIIIEELSLKQIKFFFLEGESTILKFQPSV